VDHRYEPRVTTYHAYGAQLREHSFVSFSCVLTGKQSSVNVDLKCTSGAWIS
jgi:hypothetical protein